MASCCAVCLEAVPERAATWTCPTCRVLLHLSCAQSHAASATRTGARLLHALLSATVGVVTWRCPACHDAFPESAYPRDYRCACGRTKDPDFDPFLPPHTCGGVCRRPRASCAHPCSDRCHPGLCPDCVAVVSVACFCGQQTLAKRCGQGAASCGGKCARTGRARAAAAGDDGHDGGDPLSQLAALSVRLCTHPCSAVCHEGPCKPCLLPVPGARCRCGKSAKTLPCFKRAWSCAEVCGNPLACGRHTCALECHDGPCPPCATAAAVRSCPCGRERYADLPCDQAAPKCAATCGKALACGVAEHACERGCHDGPCGPCLRQVETSCRCGAKPRKARLCADGPYVCETKCLRTRNCGKHACRRRCCLGLGPAPVAPGSVGGLLLLAPSPAAAAGAAGGSASSSSDEAGEDPASPYPRYCPPCRELCHERLACGSHSCSAFCHPGACRPCPLTVTLQCACGGTAITVPCGSERGLPPPACDLFCRKPPTCTHEQGGPAPTPHACHFGPCPPCALPCGRLHARCGHACGNQCHGQTPCAPCVVPVLRRCVGAHEERALACSAPALFKCAAAACGRPLACGTHTCPLPCHAPAAGCGPGGKGVCGKSCGRPRPPGCGHPCSAGAAAGAGGAGGVGEGVGACHPGACPTCPVTTRRRCHCGSTDVTRTCAELTDTEAPAADPFSCGARCRGTLTCGHGCTSICHAGDCEGKGGACRRTVNVRCPCGAVREQWTCERAREAAGGPSRVCLPPCGGGTACGGTSGGGGGGCGGGGAGEAPPPVQQTDDDEPESSALPALSPSEVVRNRKAAAAARREAEAAAALAAEEERRALRRRKAAEEEAASRAAAEAADKAKWSRIWNATAVGASLLLLLLVWIVAGGGEGE